MAIVGLGNSFRHVDNGMTLEDMQACMRVATFQNEVIIFRSTGSWSLRWIKLGYPTKNFHVKGKSSDWGPQAGFVPRKGIYSKVGGDAVKAQEGSAANLEGIVHKYAGEVQLSLSAAELRLQLVEPAGNPSKLAIADQWPIARSRDVLLRALRSGDGQEFFFRAVWRAERFHIFVHTGKASAPALRDKAALAVGVFTPALQAEFEPFMVMTSSEINANNLPMTGDYDLMAVCPPWREYGAHSSKVIKKPAVDFGPGRPTEGLRLPAGRNLDQALDMSSNTGAVGHTAVIGGKTVKTTFQGLGKGAGGWQEHNDMGNVTGRILRCINALNAAMPRGEAAFRRVHHNAESHRNHIFGAISGAEMEGGDGVPLTVFQPDVLCRAGSPTARFGDVATIETLSEFKEYAVLLDQAGYFVPRNWTWGMSLRDKAKAGVFADIENAIGGKALIAAARVDSYRK